MEIGRRARGTMRIAKRLLRRVRDFAQVAGDSVITLERTKRALDSLGIDDEGIDLLARAHDVPSTAIPR